MAGLSKNDLLACAGMPDKGSRSGGSVFLSYARTMPGAGPTCWATVEMVEGKVAGVVEKPSPGASLELCAMIFARCRPGAPALAPSPSPAAPAKAAPGSRGCPDGWKDVGRGECYPLKPIFGGD